MPATRRLNKLPARVAANETTKPPGSRPTATPLPRVKGTHGHLQQIIAGLSDGVILIEPDQTVSWANEAALAMHGATTIGELGTTVAEYRARFVLTHRNRHSLADGDFPVDRLIGGEVFEEVVVAVTRADRPEQHWVHKIRSLVLTDAEQAPELLVLVIKDVTERFEAEERFERTFDANPAPAVICRLHDLRYVKVNTGFLEMTGFARQEVIGRSVYDLDVLAEAENREAAVGLLREGRTIRQQEACIPVAGGGAKFVVVAGQPIELAEQACMLFTFIDLEQRKKIEDTLRQSEQRFSIAFKLAPVPMAVVSLDDHLFIDVNEAFATLTGHSHAELLGRSSAEVGLWESPAARAALQAGFARAGSVRDHEIRLRTRSGELLDSLVSAERVNILDKPCILQIVRDITERKRSETELFTAIETVMQDTSWFTQKVIEKVASLRRPETAAGPGDDGLAQLTERELEVLGLLCTGAGNEAIAGRLGVSRHTVRNHLSAIYDKVGVHSRGEAIVWARDRGLMARSGGRTAAPASLALSK
ncbi:MAG: PAS domain S-box protein [Janthinobacterium lividum]